jgi:hypothetical protein
MISHPSIKPRFEAILRREASMDRFGEIKVQNEAMTLSEV